MRLIFATNNKNKLREIKGILGEKYKDFIFSLEDLDIKVNPEENGKDFKENADIKSKAVYEELKKQNKLKSDDYIISDDTGLCINYLDGAPGLMSARFMGKDTSQLKKNEKIIELMKDAKESERDAHFITVISVIEVKALDESPKMLSFEGRIDGRIATKIEGITGFGYDPIFAVNGITYSDLGEARKNAISHRARALEAFLPYLEKNHHI